MKKNIKVTLLIWSLAAIILSACSTSSFTMGWSSSSHDNEMTAQYATFSGTEYGSVFEAETGQEITLDYALEMKKGAVVIRLRELGGETVWETDALEQDGDISEHITITVPESAQYQVSVEGKRAGGSYAVSWLLD